MAAVAVEERVASMAPHGGRVPVLNDPRAGPDPTAWKDQETHGSLVWPPITQPPVNHCQNISGTASRAEGLMEFESKSRCNRTQYANRKGCEFYTYFFK